MEKYLELRQRPSNIIVDIHSIRTCSFDECLMLNAETQRRGDAEKIENLPSEQVLDAAIEVHRTLGGPGLLESL
jgi:hypothetical protein